MLSELPIHSPSPSSTMGRPRRPRRSCWKLWIRTLTSVRESSWGIVWRLNFRFQLTNITITSVHILLHVLINSFISVSGILTWRGPSTRKQHLMVTLVVTSFHGRCPSRWNTEPLLYCNLQAGLRCTTDKPVCPSTSLFSPPPPLPPTSYLFFLTHTATSPQPLLHEEMFHLLAHLYEMIQLQILGWTKTDLSSAACFYSSLFWQLTSFFVLLMVTINSVCVVYT